jgi:flagella basal body P-ring formation protein FlgA
MIHKTLILVGICVLTGFYSLKAYAETVSVSGPWITLGDVADASGPLAKVKVAPSPDPGETLKLDPQFVGKIARSNGVYFSTGQTSPIVVNRVSNSAHKSNSSRVPSDNKKPSEKHTLVVSTDLKRGDIIQASDLKWMKLPANRIKPSGTPASMSDVIGKEL